MRRRIAMASALCATVVLQARPAHPQNTDPCLTAPVDGQTMRRAGKLSQAIQQFNVCARKSCPAEIVADCVRWEQEATSAIPSVVLAARDGSGRDLANVRVSIDGQPPTEIATTAIEIDPGQHTFVFKQLGSTDVELSLILREGEKNRAVVGTFAAPEATSASRGGIPLSSWILGGLGAAALASFATFGSIGLSQRASYNCSSGCTQSQNDTVESNFRIADISLAVGIAAAGVATVIYLLRPSIAQTDGAALVEPVGRWTF